jgi:hypothetical protein
MAANEEMVAVFDILRAEVQTCSNHLDETTDEQDEGKQFWRRAVVRVTFAEIEAIVWELKRVALAGRNLRDVNFSPGEIALLEEKTYELKGNGEMQERKARLNFRDNLRFAFKAFARVTSSTFELDVSGQGWEDLRRAITIRDRLMHPKGAISLHVSAEERDVVLKAATWFHFEMFRLLNVSNFTQAQQRLDEWIMSEVSLDDLLAGEDD